MKNKTLQQLLFIAAIGLFSQFSAAQDANSAAAKQIADIIVSMNHFPSGPDKATLSKISEDTTLEQAIRDMAKAVSNIQHMPSPDAKAAMAEIQGNDQVKALAGIIANFSHMASADAKAELAKLFP